ncbi:hypothetical protein H8S90_16240 [Olivibacter sp. SDN3]|nr:hypothetical protein [Olivibacter sp. SDN3]QNL48338.1 hypothetical protein H8S90_16240 [Olivibacter sp. SDN3]
MLPFTQNTLDKLEALFKRMGYKVRYEKGNFRTGSCMLQSSKVIVVNRFSNIEVKINSLLDLLKTIDPDTSKLDEKQKQFYYTIKQTL